jgi:hypothetical protein
MHTERIITTYLVNTFLLHIPLLALNDRLTERMTEIELILVGLGNLPGSSRLILVWLGNLPGSSR